jgi:hypothetical protein
MKEGENCRLPNPGINVFQRRVSLNRKYAAVFADPVVGNGFPAGFFCPHVKMPFAMSAGRRLS